MKNIFSLALVMSVTLHAYAQAPQGFNYQAVVLNTSGVALSNQTVSLQLSILDSAASGVAVYVETQNPTTDTTGLFSVVIGNGTVVSGNFSTINWGKNNKFLKTEIDTAGGTNYVLMGISQMMSVPYALYANRTKEKFVSIGMPDGMENMSPVVIDSLAYTVPLGKNLYVPISFSYVLYGIDTLQLYGSGLSTFAGFSEGQTISSIYGYQGPTQCYLIDKSVDWITQDILISPLTVPAGKIFVVIFLTSNPNAFYLSGGGYAYPNLFLNGNQIANNPYYGMMLFPGQTLSAQLTGAPGQLIVNGYFRDN